MEGENERMRIQASVSQNVGNLCQREKVIDARSRFAKKVIAPEYFGRLTPDVEEAIERAIFVKKTHPFLI